jgi:2-(1,2-epoxy-1,2-dihydrophenyl)acetyl-CoA isomerase
MSEGLITQVENNIARMTINRPEARNALSSELIQEMVNFVLAIEHDKSVRALLITGAGAHFAAGGDVKGFAPVLSLPPEELRADFERRSVAAAPLWLSLERIPQPVVCAARGFTAGAALSLIAGADYTLVSDNAQFLLAHVGIGLVADGATTYHLPRAIGIRKAKELAFFGDRINAQQALELGLINKIVPEASLEEETEAVLRRFAAAPATSVACAKRMMNASLNNTMQEALDMETFSVGECGATADLKEGVMAFMEKRKPVFGKQ